MTTVRVVVEGLPEFQRALKKYAPEVHKEFRVQARGALAAIVSDAQSRASWSRRIPRAIAPMVTQKAVGVRLSKRRAPHGSLYERGSTGRPDAVRHPLFGNRQFWFEEPTRPFLQPAVDAHREDAIVAMLKAVDEAKGKVGLHD